MPIRVILIDDEQTILDGMKQLINWSEHGFQLIGTFSSPLKALDFSLAHAIDIVVTDVMMPELNGIELSRLLKQQQPETQILSSLAMMNLIWLKILLKKASLIIF